MPTLSAPPPPTNRRRSPAPATQSQKLSNPLPPPTGNAGSLQPPPSAGLKSPGSILSTNNGRFEIPNATAPLFSLRQNTPNYPLSSLARARTPVSAVQQPVTTPVSAPVPAVPLASPLPRPPMSAAPYRPRDRADSFREREQDNESYRERLPRSARASPVPRSPAPRSGNRPGSAMGQRTPTVAVAQHEGMI